jgi:acyl carrier protein
MALTAFAVTVSLVQPAKTSAQLFSKPAVPATPRPIPVLQAPLPGFDYPQHETLTFTVDWRVFTAGTAVFHLDQSGDGLKISATADSVGAVNMLFPVVDRFQSGFDLKTGCSTGFNKQIQEGRRKIASELTFDYAHGKQAQNERNLVKGTATHKESNIPACVTDSLSALFYTQSQTLTPGQTVYFPLADSMRTVTVGMKVEDREEIKTPAGTFQTIKVQATADEGVVKNRGSIWIWYTDDPRHLPVQMQARLFWGTITFHLQSVDFK